MLNNQTKICCRCKIDKPIIEFAKDKYAKDGLQFKCRLCDKEYQQANKEVLAEKRKIYNNSRKEKLRIYQQLNKEKIAKYLKEYHNTPKGKASHKNARYKRRAKLKEGDVTSQQILELQQTAKVCYWCHASLKNKIVHIDHYIPLSKGGEHTLSNLVVSCDKCNLQKYATDPIEFANKLGRLL